MLGLKAISFWVGACDTRGQGPPAHWLSLPFYIPEVAWPLSPLAPAARGRWTARTTGHDLWSWLPFAALPPFPVLPFLPLRLRCPVCGLYLATAVVVAPPSPPPRTRTTQQANYAPSPSEWGMRVGDCKIQKGERQAVLIFRALAALLIPCGAAALNERRSDIPPLWLKPHLAAIHPSLG